MSQPHSIPRTDAEEWVDQINWFIACLEDRIKGVPVRGLAEAEAGFDSAISDVRSELERLRAIEEQFETIEERLDIALGALHDITGMNHNDQRGTVFQFEQRVHKVAHDAWMAARGKATNPASSSIGGKESA